MKFTKLILAFATAALAVASAASSYKVQLPDSTWVGQTQLKPGQYKVAIEGDKAVFTSGKSTVAEVPATVEKNAQKYSTTALESNSSKLQEIHVGGTNMKIVLKPGGSAGSAAANQ